MAESLLTLARRAISGVTAICVGLSRIVIPYLLRASGETTKEPARGTDDAGRAVGNRQEGSWGAMAIESKFAFSPLVGFRSEKAAQACAFFASKNGGHIEKMALAKLLYIAERESIKQRGRPLLYDEYYSIKHGPVCSSALNGINGNIDQGVWSKYIRLEGASDVVVQPNAPDGLEEMSNSDLRLLEKVFADFGTKTARQLRAWTHSKENCPEYTEVESGRIPISLEDVVRAVSDLHPRDISRVVHSYRSLERTLPSPAAASLLRRR
jgi:uncharacterized phage-associated protein